MLNRFSCSQSSHCISSVCRSLIKWGESASKIELYCLAASVALVRMRTGTELQWRTCAPNKRLEKKNRAQYVFNCLSGDDGRCAVNDHKCGMWATRFSCSTRGNLIQILGCTKFYSFLFNKFHDLNESHLRRQWHYQDCINFVAIVPKSAKFAIHRSPHMIRVLRNYQNNNVN